MMEMMPIKHVEVSFDKTAEPKPLHANFYINDKSTTDDQIAGHTEFARGAIVQAINQAPLNYVVCPKFEGRIQPHHITLAEDDELHSREVNAVRFRGGFSDPYCYADICGTDTAIAATDVIVFATILRNIVIGIYEYSQRANTYLIQKRISHVTVTEHTGDYAGSNDKFVFAMLRNHVFDSVQQAIYSRVFYRPFNYVLEYWDKGVIRFQTPEGLHVDIVLVPDARCAATRVFHSVSIFYPPQVKELLDNLMHWDREIITRYVP